MHAHGNEEQQNISSEQRLVRNVPQASLRSRVQGSVRSSVGSQREDHQRKSFESGNGLKYRVNENLVPKKFPKTPPLLYDHIDCHLKLASFNVKKAAS